MCTPSFFREVFSTHQWLLMLPQVQHCGSHQVNKPVLGPASPLLPWSQRRTSPRVLCRHPSQAHSSCHFGSPCCPSGPLAVKLSAYFSPALVRWLAATLNSEAVCSSSKLGARHECQCQLRPVHGRVWNGRTTRQHEEAVHCCLGKDGQASWQQVPLLAAQG